MAHWDPKGTLDSIGLGKSEQKRSTRVADAIRNELAILLLKRVRDPKISGVTITRAEVSDDLKYARIFFTVFGEETSIKEAEKGLQRARGFMRSHLAKTLNLRYTPDLQFRYDMTAEKVKEIETLFQEIAGEKDGNENNS